MLNQLKQSTRSRRMVLLGVAVLLVFCAVKFVGVSQTHALSTNNGDYATAVAKRGPFRQVVRRTGVLKPMKEQHIYTQVDGVILEMAQQGKVVAKDEVVLRMDPAGHEDMRVAQVAQMTYQMAEFKSSQQTALKVLNQGKEDVISYGLRVELEQMRLLELKKGPSATEQINAEVNLENSKNLLEARESELKVLEELAATGFASAVELRQKRLQVTEQKLNVEQSELALQKLDRIDPVKLAEQELKVRDMQKTQQSAQERVVLLERNIQRDTDRFDRRRERETLRLKDLVKNIEKCVHLAPGPGVVIHKRNRWYAFAPGREVWDGQEVMALPDFNQMKVVLTVDEARIANVAEGQSAEIRPAGWSGEPFKGIVTKVADKGRDEFESYQEETIAIFGSANRQVFDIEVEIEGKSPMLRPGLRADVEIIMSNLENVITVPRTSLVRETNAPPFVRAMSSSGGEERREVKVIAENELIAAVEGVDENQRVWIVGRN